MKLEARNVSKFLGPVQGGGRRGFRDRAIETLVICCSTISFLDVAEEAFAIERLKLFPRGLYAVIVKFVAEEAFAIERLKPKDVPLQVEHIHPVAEEAFAIERLKLRSVTNAAPVIAAWWQKRLSC